MLIDINTDIDIITAIAINACIYNTMFNLIRNDRAKVKAVNFDIGKSPQN